MEKLLKRVSSVFFPPVDPVESVNLPSEAEEMARIKEEIRAAESRFALLSDDQAITAAIYQLSALEARYDLLVRRVKAAAEPAG